MTDRWLNTAGGNLTSSNTYFDSGTVQTATGADGSSATFAYLLPIAKPDGAKKELSRAMPREAVAKQVEN